MDRICKRRTVYFMRMDVPPLRPSPSGVLRTLNCISRRVRPTPYCKCCQGKPADLLNKQLKKPTGLSPGSFAVNSLAIPFPSLISPLFRRTRSLASVTVSMTRPDLTPLPLTSWPTLRPLASPPPHHTRTSLTTVRPAQDPGIPLRPRPPEAPIQST